MSRGRIYQYIIILVILFASVAFVERDLLAHNQFLNLGWRKYAVREALEAQEETGKFFLLKREGEILPLESLGDDWGLYLAVSLCSASLRSLGVTVGPFKILILVGLFFVGSYTLCSVITFRNSQERNRGPFLFGIALAATLGLFSMDAYTAGMLPCGVFTLLMTMPKSMRGGKIYLGLLVLFALTCNIAELFRSKAGVLPLAGMFVYQLYQSRRNAATLLLSILVTGGLIQFGTGQLRAERDQWLTSHNKQDTAGLVNSHVVWHALFVGLSYDRIGGVEHSDLAGYNLANESEEARNVAAQTVDSYHLGSNYESFVREQYLDIVKKHPLLTLYSYSKRFLVTLGTLLFVSGLWTLGASVALKRITSEFRFTAVTCVVLAGPAVLVYPYPMYFLGGIALAPSLSLLLENNSQSTFSD